MAGDFCGVAGTPAASKGWGCVIVSIPWLDINPSLLLFFFFLFLLALSSFSSKTVKPCPFGDQIKFGSYFPIFNILTFPLITNSPQLFNITTPTFEILLWPISKLIFKFFIFFCLMTIIPLCSYHPLRFP